MNTLANSATATRGWVWAGVWPRRRLEDSLPLYGLSISLSFVTCMTIFIHQIRNKLDDCVVSIVLRSHGLKIVRWNYQIPENRGQQEDRRESLVHHAQDWRICWLSSWHLNFHSADGLFSKFLSLRPNLYGANITSALLTSKLVIEVCLPNIR